MRISASSSLPVLYVGRVLSQAFIRTVGTIRTVREPVVVYVNGKRAGSVWCPPYELEITPWLHNGGNMFHVVVGNLALNSMAGKSPPDYRLLNIHYGKRFDP